MFDLDGALSPRSSKLEEAKAQPVFHHVQARSLETEDRTFASSLRYGVRRSTKIGQSFAQYSVLICRVCPLMLTLPPLAWSRDARESLFLIPQHNVSDAFLSIASEGGHLAAIFSQ